MTLTWVGPADDNNAMYRVSYTTPSFLGSMNLFSETDDNTRMIVISDLHPGEYYTFTVRAINEGSISGESVPLTIRTTEEGILKSLVDVLIIIIFNNYNLLIYYV